MAAVFGPYRQWLCNGRHLGSASKSPRATLLPPRLRLVKALPRPSEQMSTSDRPDEGINEVQGIQYTAPLPASLLSCPKQGSPLSKLSEQGPGLQLVFLVDPGVTNFASSIAQT